MKLDAGCASLQTCQAPVWPYRCGCRPLHSVLCNLEPDTVMHYEDGSKASCMRQHELHAWLDNNLEQVPATLPAAAAAPPATVHYWVLMQARWQVCRLPHLVLPFSLLPALAPRQLLVWTASLPAAQAAAGGQAAGGRGCCRGGGSDGLSQNTHDLICCNASQAAGCRGQNEHQPHLQGPEEECQQTFCQRTRLSVACGTKAVRREWGTTIMQDKRRQQLACALSDGKEYPGSYSVVQRAQGGP